jgi:hypothetical protein
MADSFIQVATYSILTIPESLCPSPSSIGYVKLLLKQLEVPSTASPSPLSTELSIFSASDFTALACTKYRRHLSH